LVSPFPSFLEDYYGQSAILVQISYIPLSKSCS
jgi:hypothetical protein